MKTPLLRVQPPPVQHRHALAFLRKEAAAHIEGLEPPVSVARRLALGGLPRLSLLASLAASRSAYPTSAMLAKGGSMAAMLILMLAAAMAAAVASAAAHDAAKPIRLCCRGGLREDSGMRDEVAWGRPAAFRKTKTKNS